MAKPKNQIKLMVNFIVDSLMEGEEITEEGWLANEGYYELVRTGEYEKIYAIQ